ncbi:MAG: alpha-galactosidase [Eubacteriales bacterium]|jgi:alpha-galactosidase
MIRLCENTAVLATPETVYMFRVLPTGQLEHLYYGPRCLDAESESDSEILMDAEALGERKEFAPGNAISWSQENPSLAPEDLREEISSRGKGDIRDTFVELVHPDGGRTSDFLFDHMEVMKSWEPSSVLPSSCADPSDPVHGRADHLRVVLKEASGDSVLELFYHVYEDCDVITRNAKLTNTGDGKITVRRLMSMQLDFETDGFVMSVFTGAWAREMNRHDMKVEGGRVVNSTLAGVSSSRNNPFVMLWPSGTTEQAGLCYGMNLVYSGNHYESAEVNAFGKTRFLSGINPEGFAWALGPGESFESPEAFMTCSAGGFCGMSLHMQHFIREHIVRGEWKHRLRPILLNSWEAAYFDIDERKLLRLAKAGKEAGMELFVMDDGWFGNRSDDTKSLGDWSVNLKKIPGGLKKLSDEIHALGMDFGIWVEPEMVSPDSDLYRAHPDWAMKIPGRAHAEGRNQMMLDLANPEVTDALIGELSRLFASADINYVKWDFNRIMSDVYSPYVEKLHASDGTDVSVRQGETAHRFILGFYRMASELTRRFPHILFEGCAAGGGRFDPGVLCYFPQIWGSDDTDPVQRAVIQEGYSYGYPMSVVSAHVSASPNHQTLRETPLDTRFNVAAFGIFGYELNLCDLGKREFEEIKKQTELYKQWREVLQRGDFYRGRSGRIHEWTCVLPDRSSAVGMILQEKAIPNAPFEQFRAGGLDPKRRYHLYSLQQRRDVRCFGDLVNTVAPVHVRPGSFLHRMIASFVTMPGEQEEMNVTGALLMRAGVKLAPGYAGTGYNENTRYFADGCSRMYFMEGES